MFVYVGTYTEPPNGKAQGIYVCSFDAGSGALTVVETVAGVANPSFLAADGGRRFLYAVNEVAEGQVSAFARDLDSGALTYLNSQSTQGADPCHVALDHAGNHVLAANYSSGSIAVFPISGDGSLAAASSAIQHEGSSVAPERQEGPHAHMIAPTPDGQSILVTDLGTDEVVIYRLDTETGQLAREGAFLLDPGSGPRHFAFSPNGRFLYVLNELASTLSVFEYHSEHLAFPLVHTVSTLPRDFSGENWCAHVVAAADGRFVYASNRGHDSITIWLVDETTGELSLVDIPSTGGKEPRNFAIDPSGDWLLAANQKSDTIVSFRRDQKTGTLKATGVMAEVPTPVCIVFSDRKVAPKVHMTR